MGDIYFDDGRLSCEVETDHCCVEFFMDEEQCLQIYHEMVEYYNSDKSLPLGEQKHPVLIGREKDHSKITIQCDGRYVEIPMEYVRDMVLGLVSILPDED